ncbi:MAG: hypothetical protein ACRBK7_04060 [Acidimicrobiales bacterium]
MSVETELVAYGRNGKYLRGVSLEIFGDAISWLLNQYQDEFPYNFLSGLSPESEPCTSGHRFAEAGLVSRLLRFLDSLVIGDLLAIVDGPAMERSGVYPVQTGFWLSESAVRDLGEVFVAMKQFGSDCLKLDVGSIAVSSL